jgi:hypothetical protein
LAKVACGVGLDESLLLEALDLLLSGYASGRVDVFDLVFFTNLVHGIHQAVCGF